MHRFHPGDLIKVKGDSGAVYEVVASNGDGVFLVKLRIYRGQPSIYPHASYEMSIDLVDEIVRDKLKEAEEERPLILNMNTKPMDQ